MNFHEIVGQRATELDFEDDVFAGLIIRTLGHMGVDHRTDGGQVPQNLKRGDCPPDCAKCCKILSTRLLALQCRKMCFFASTAGLLQ